MLKPHEGEGFSSPRDLPDDLWSIEQLNRTAWQQDQDVLSGSNWTFSLLHGMPSSEVRQSESPFGQELLSAPVPNELSPATDKVPTWQ